MKGFFTFLLLALSGLVLLGLIGRGNQKAEKPDPAKAVYYTCREYIHRQLKAPSSASFSNYISDPNTGANLRSDGLWEAFGHVDAQNSFGAMLRDNWHVVIDSSTGTVKYARLGKTIMGDSTYAQVRVATPAPKPGDWMLSSYRNSLDKKAR